MHDDDSRSDPTAVALFIIARLFGVALLLYGLAIAGAPADLAADQTAIRVARAPAGDCAAPAAPAGPERGD